MKKILTLVTFVLILSTLVIIFLKEKNTNDLIKKTSDVKSLSSPVLTIAAAGDIACDVFTSGRKQCQQRETADLVEKINPDHVLVLGDLQYGNHLLNNQSPYHATWGKFKNITLPTVGNHEYDNGKIATYYQYFGKLAGEVNKGWYSLTKQNWRLISLNSNCYLAGGCHKGSPQYNWLEKELENNQIKCTLAFWHHPLFSSGQHGKNANMQDFWELLYQHNVDLILNGHDHSYERFSKQDPFGKLDEKNGITQFVVGTGGRNLYSIPMVLSNSVVRQSENFGILKLTLKKAEFSWELITTKGELLDQGSDYCN